MFIDMHVHLREPGREDKGVQSKKENKDGGNDFSVCVCTDQQLSACEIADIYKLTDSAKL